MVRAARSAPPPKAMRIPTERSSGRQTRVVRVPRGSEQALTIPIQKARTSTESDIWLVPVPGRGDALGSR